MRNSSKKVILRFGNPVKTFTEPGWGVRIPLVDSVRVFDRRLQYLNAEPSEVVIGRGDKLIVDYYVIWRITDPVAFLSAFPLEWLGREIGFGNESTRSSAPGSAS